MQMSSRVPGEVITTIPKIDFNEEVVEYKKIIQTAQDAATQKVQKTVKVPQIRDCELSDGFFQLESRGPTKSGQQAEAAATSRRCFTATKEDLEQNTTDIPAVVQRQELGIQKAPRTVDITLLQCTDTTDVPVAK